MVKERHGTSGNNFSLRLQMAMSPSYQVCGHIASCVTVEALQELGQWKPCKAQSLCDETYNAWKPSQYAYFRD